MSLRLRITYTVHLRAAVEGGECRIVGQVYVVVAVRIADGTSGIDDGHAIAAETTLEAGEIVEIQVAVKVGIGEKLHVDAHVHHLGSRIRRTHRDLPGVISEGGVVRHLEEERGFDRTASRWALSYS